MSVYELYTQLFARNWRCGRFAWSLSQGCSEKIRKKDVSWLQGDGRADQFRSCSSRCSGDLQWKLDLLLWPRDQVTEFPVELPDPRRLDRANLPTKFWWSLFWQHWYDLHAPGSHWTDSQQGILCWGFKGVQEEIPLEEANTLQIGSVAFPLGQCSSPQLHPCPRQFDQDGHQSS